MRGSYLKGNITKLNLGDGSLLDLSLHSFFEVIIKDSDFPFPLENLV